MLLTGPSHPAEQADLGRPCDALAPLGRAGCGRGWGSGEGLPLGLQMLQAWAASHNPTGRASFRVAPCCHPWPQPCPRPQLPKWVLPMGSPGGKSERGWTVRSRHLSPGSCPLKPPEDRSAPRSHPRGLALHSSAHCPIGWVVPTGGWS